ncbi:hypothetical protein [Oceanobacillus sp. J11TS1]|uniref:hypothetical protein n=1 Tax=Oceanobacillus sp. J11TS1 TaxID=2807191 RepID=UPI001B0B73A6|nr:hypothetical protein [Oceanobacillus sp. J11TS1]GIO22453.1 hypothetical protein J11TS1_10340 [Oceanobacillus sp. J11TS1]
MSEENYPYRPYQSTLNKLGQIVEEKKQLQQENQRLRNQIEAQQKDIKELLACCSLEKKVDYKIKEWQDASFEGSPENDRKIFAVRLTDFIRKELQ